jgi:hypothetical protein
MLFPPQGDCAKLPIPGTPVNGVVTIENSKDPGIHTVEVAQLVIV